MQKNTIHNSFLLKYLLSPLSKIILKLLGWKIKQSIPSDVPKYVLIVNPHTSAWDMLYALLFVFSKKLRVYIMLKSTAVKKLWKRLFLWAGIVPIDRKQANNRVQQIIDFFNQEKEFGIMIAPGGTRAKVKKWKTGFYYIAKGANIPIALGYGDYKKKELGILSVFYPTNDLEKDIKDIQEIYRKAKITGKHPEKQLV